MNTRFEISCDDWISEVDGDPERATMTNLVIRADEKKLTRLEDVFSRSTRDGPRISAYILAKWLAANWWRLKYEPAGTGMDWKMSHMLGAAGGGYVWPDITFEGDGDGVLLLAKATEGKGYEPIRYIYNTSVYVVGEDFEKGIELFIEKVIERICDSRVGGRDLQEIWKEIQQERSDSEVVDIRRLEAILGNDPGEAPQELIESIIEKGKEIGKEAAEEVAAANTAEPLTIIDELNKRTSKVAQNANMPEIDRLRARIRDKTTKELLVWQKAEMAARVARDFWDIAKGPIDNDKLSDLFGINRDFLSTADKDGAAPMPVGYRNGDGETLGLVLKKKRRESRRFMFARLIADNIYANDSDRILPATGKRTARQKYQRAFAHEFLCPYDDLTDILTNDQPDDEAIEEAAEYFDVSPLLVKTKLVNKGRLDRDVLPDY